MTVGSLPTRLPLASQPSHRTSTCQFINIVLPLFFPLVFLSPLRSRGLLFFGVYWLLILPRVVVFYHRAVLCAFFFTSSVCVCNSFCCLTPSPFLPIMGPTVRTLDHSCLPGLCICVYHYKMPSLCRIDRVFLPVIPRYLFCCRDPSPTHDHCWLSTVSFIILFLFARTRCNQFIFLHVRVHLRPSTSRVQ